MKPVTTEPILWSAAEACPRFAAAADESPLPWLRLVSLAGEGLTEPDPERVERQLEFLTYLVDRAAAGATEPRVRLRAMQQVLCLEEGLRGNLEDYHDPRNSYLVDVLRRGLGLPITLGAVYIAVAERLGWPLVGIDYPGHFLLRYLTPDELLVVDPFDAGKVIGVDRCLELAGPVQLEVPEAQRRLMARMRLEEPIAPERLVERVLKNLETWFIDAQDFEAAKNVIQKLLLLSPESADELRDLGSICHLLGEYDEALRCLRGYLGHHPHASERRRIEAIIARLEELSAES